MTCTIVTHSLNISISVCWFLCVCMCVYTQAHYASTLTYTHTCKNINHTDKHAHIYTHAHARTHTHTHAHTHTHTHTHTGSIRETKRALCKLAQSLQIFDGYVYVYVYVCMSVCIHSRMRANSQNGRVSLTIICLGGCVRACVCCLHLKACVQDSKFPGRPTVCSYLCTCTLFIFLHTHQQNHPRAHTSKR